MSDAWSVAGTAGVTTTNITVESAEPALQIVPLGGLGEFGMNLTAVSFGDTLVIIDAGVAFPGPDLPGVDLVIPDLSYLEHRARPADALVLTHAHEDHMGAVAHVLQHVEGPVYGTPLTLAMAAGKLDEHGVDARKRLVPVGPGDRIAIGPLTVEFIAVNHSVPDAVALALHTPVGTVVHTGDFKIDQTPPDGRHFDFHRFAELGRQGVLALLGDSTNVERPGVTGSERDVIPAFEDLFAGTGGRLVVTAFATSLYRLQILIDLAARFHRKVALLGRGMIENSQIGQRLGHLRLPAGLALRETDVRQCPAGQLLCITTGSQGEPLAALSRIAIADHRYASVEAGDRVVFSARAIPGHEVAINRLVNHLARRGVEVVDAASRAVHVSGHGSREELKSMLSLVRPRYFVPIHGEFRQRSLHGRLAAAVSSAWPQPAEVLMLDNGDVLRFDRDGARVAGRVPAGRILIDRPGLVEVDEEVLRDRRHLAEDGLVVVVLAINKQTGALEGDPDLVTRGLALDAGADAALREAGPLLAELLRATSVEERTDPGQVKERVRIEVRRFFRKRLGRRPLVVPVVMET